MNRILFLIVLPSFVLLSGRMAGQPPNSKLSGCRATLSNDTLVLENEHIARRFHWNNGQLIRLNLTDKKSTKSGNGLAVSQIAPFQDIMRPPAKASWL